MNDVDENVADNVVAFQGELMLLSWSDSSSRGRTVTFLVSEDSPEHPFKFFTMKQGKRAGARFMAALAKISEDESYEKHPTISQQAALLCKQERFWHWCSEHSFDTVTSEQGARFFILTLCKIKSRSELDSNADAASVFRYQIQQPFEAYVRAVEANL